MGAVLERSVTALFVLRLEGGACLIYLAWLSARSVLSGHPGNGVDPHAGGRNLFRHGLIFNLSNPKAVLAWMAVLSLGMGPDQGKADLAWAALACALLGGLIYAGYAVAFAHASIRTACRSRHRFIDGAVAAGFGYAGFRLLTSGARCDGLPVGDHALVPRGSHPHQ